MVLAALAPGAAAAQAPTPPPVPDRYDADAEEPSYEHAAVAPPTTDTARLDALGFGQRPLALHVERMDGDAPAVDHCVAPCQLDVSPGRYRLAIAPRGGGPRDADGGPVTLFGGRHAVQMTYDHRIGERSLGWTFLCMALSVVVSIAPLQSEILMAVVAAPIGIALTIPALALIFLEDSARVQVTPLPPPGGGAAVP